MSAFDDWARSVASKYGVMALAYSQLATLFKNPPVLTSAEPTLSGSSKYFLFG